MVLSEPDILEKILRPSNQYIKDWRAEHALLDLYMNGGDVSSALEKVKNYENDEQKKLRDNIARSTKDLVSYLLNPLNKIFSASGFNSELEFSNDTIKESFEEYLEKLPEGMSMRKWMKTYWLEAFVTDPNGIILIESENVDEQPKSYPTYKSINVIHDYQTKWDKFEYIIFLHKKVIIEKEEVQVYRVYDDAFDALYYVKNNRLYKYGNETDEDGFDEPHSVVNTLGYIPAQLASDIIEKKTGGKKSFINKIDESLKEFMRDSSVHSIYKFLHGFPIFWAYSTKCSTCEGTGRIPNPRRGQEGQSDTIQCPTCNGKRLQVTKDVSDGVRLPIPQGADDPKLAPDIAGYVTPDLETWQKQLDEMHEMKSDMYYALWGTHIVEEQGKEKTATEVYINKEPLNDTLSSVSSTAEQKETALVRYMADAMHPGLVSDISIKYGKRFLIETPDVLWEKYITAKEKKAPQSTLDYLYRQFLMVEYHNDTAMLEQKMKEFNLEPFVHYSLMDLKGIATSEQLQSKLLYTEWVTEDIDFTKDFETLKTEFETYVKNNLKVEERPEIPTL